MLLNFDDLPKYRDHVLCDGAFDPLHAGHIQYLAAARTKGPVVCAVASDEQIRGKGKIPFLPQRQRVALMEAIGLIDHVYAKDRPTEQVLEQLRPRVYVKGKDWAGTLPYEQIDVLARYDIPVWYPQTVRDSSTARLRAWALADAEQSLDRLEVFMAKQQPASQPWQPVTDYSFEARKAIEGPHAQLIKEVLQPRFILDAGCGPEGILVRLLREIGVKAYGLDKHPPNGDWFYLESISTEWFPPEEAYRYDVAICREVLEHLTIPQVGRAVANLFRWASRFVYITTRFSADGVFDADTEFEVDPTHITCLSQPFLRSLCVLNGGKRRRDLEAKLDHMNKGRVLVYEV